MTAKVSTSLYRKPTDTGTYWHFRSYHSEAQKKALVTNEFLRMFRIASDDVDKKPLEIEIRKRFLNNGYPPWFIERSLRRARLIEDETIHRTACNDKKKIHLCIPHHPPLEAALRDLLRSDPVYLQEITLSVKPASNIASMCLKHLHPRSPGIFDCVYCIPCSICSQKYIGETERCVSTRVGEHRRPPSSAKPKSACQEHRISTGHDLNWVQTSILGQSRDWYRRSFQEAIAIASTETFNRKNEKPALHPIYNAIPRTLVEDSQASFTRRFAKSVPSLLQ